jgi:two-component system, NtrC family, response regulator
MKSAEDAIVFVLDSNVVYQRVTTQYLQVAGIRSVIVFSDPDKMYPSLKLCPDILITEYRFDKNAIRGRQILSKVKEISPSTDIYFHTTLRDVDAAVNALHSGAVDYIVKSSFALDELVRKILKRLQHRGCIERSKKSLRKLISYFGIVILATAGMIAIYSLF